ncbi:MAG: nuclear transport factor 2 family protein [Deltaproteobacteria bacterium]|nr:nuclear transport factor 2 family protein [Deltaproteobacteria bacterium]
MSKGEPNLMSLQTMQKEIEYLVSQYARSIDEADTDLAATLWSTTDEATFIHPRSHERGWEQVKKRLYEETMRDRFTHRKLQIHDLDVQCYENMAIAVFYWTFDAIFRSDGRLHRTQGRETQVFRYTDDRWLLVHVHYSGMPITGEREGF